MPAPKPVLPIAQLLPPPSTAFVKDGKARAAAVRIIAKARILLAPLQAGAGVKGKLLDAMTVQTPSVTTPIGAEGITSHSWPGEIANTIEEFVDDVQVDGPTASP